MKYLRINNHHKDQLYTRYSLVLVQERGTLIWKGHRQQKNGGGGDEVIINQQEVHTLRDPHTVEALDTRADAGSRTTWPASQPTRIKKAEEYTLQYITYVKFKSITIIRDAHWDTAADLLWVHAYEMKVWRTTWEW